MSVLFFSFSRSSWEHVVDASSGFLWFFKDHLGNTRHLDNASYKCDYYPYGEEHYTSGSSTQIRYTGKELDSNTGLTYFGARYYDRRIARWLAPDPAGQYWSPYAYCGNSPLVYIDENGEFAFLIPALIGAAIGAYQGYQINHDIGYTLLGAVIGGISGYASAGIGSYVTGAVGTNLAGSSSAGYWAASIGGASSSATGGAISGFGMGHLAGKSGSDVWGMTWRGALFGALSGGVSSAINYRLSSQFRWNTHETVINHAYNKGLTENAVDYVAGIGGIDPSKISYNSSLVGDQGRTVTKKGKFYAEVGPNGINDNLRNFDASNLYETVYHEGLHLQYLSNPDNVYKLNMAYSAGPDVFKLFDHMNHIDVYQKTINHQYFSMFSNGVRANAFSEFQRAINGCTTPFGIKINNIRLSL